MAFALKVKTVKCPNCGHEGKAKLKGVGPGVIALFVLLLFCSLFFWPLIVVVVVLALYMGFRPADQVCANCKYPHPVEVK